MSHELQHGTNCAFPGNEDGECTCAFAERIKIQTLDTLLAAWQKRAYEAESETDRLKNQRDESDQIASDAIRKLEKENELLKGAMAAQDERERAAAELCGIKYAEHGCDTPARMADVVNDLRVQLHKINERLEASQRIVDRYRS